MIPSAVLPARPEPLLPGALLVDVLRSYEDMVIAIILLLSLLLIIAIEIVVVTIIIVIEIVMTTSRCPPYYKELGKINPSLTKHVMTT